MKSGILAGIAAALLLSGAVARADVEISNKPTSNMSCDSGVCTATAAKAVLNVSDLATMLTSGDVAVKTGSLAKDIDIDRPLQWTSTSRLTLDAQQSVTIKKQVTVAGQGALTVITNDTGGAKAKNKTGEFIIVPEHGSVQFWDLGSSLIIDGNSYTLVGDIKTLAADIAINPSGFYALAKPYDASVDGTYSTAPIQTTFTGVFEGFGNDVSNLKINVCCGSAGLFARVDPSGFLRSARLIDIDFEGKPASGVGGLVALNVGRIERSLATGTITLQSSESNSGGLVGANFGTIISSYANMKFRVIGGTTANVGELVGENDGTISSSYASGSVVGRGTISTNLGGLVGYNEGVIENSFARTRVTAGKQEDQSLFGGLVGENYVGAQIKSSYAAGEMKIKSAGRAGGVIGQDDSVAGNVQHAYWNLDLGISNPSQGAGNIPNDPGITGLTTTQFQSKLPKGFNPKVWGSDPKINNGYPYLLANPPE